MLRIMEPKLTRWQRLRGSLRRHPVRTFALALLAGFLLLNILAYQHARAMLTFSSDTTRTPTPNALSGWQKVRVLAFGVTVPRPRNNRLPQELGLESEVIQVRAADGVNLEGWLITPQNPRGTVLLFHGYGAARSSLLEVGREFYDLGFAAVLMDFRGSGGSEGSRTSLGYFEAEDVAAALRHVRAEGLPAPVILQFQPQSR